MAAETARSALETAPGAAAISVLWRLAVAIDRQNLVERGGHVSVFVRSLGQWEEAQETLESLPVALDVGVVGSLGLREPGSLPEQRGERSGACGEHRIAILSAAADDLEA